MRSLKKEGTSENATILGVVNVLLHGFTLNSTSQKVHTCVHAHAHTHTRAHTHTHSLTSSP